MYTIGLDLHKLQTQLCIGHEDGTFEERRIAQLTIVCSCQASSSKHRTLKVTVAYWHGAEEQ